ncbi:hypothetical protein BLA29_003258, partial [Euroglyphus maynei]
IVRKADSFYPGHYSYLLHDNITYGQCIRIAHPNSLIEKKMHEKMEEYVQNPPQILEMDRFDLDDMYAFDEYLNPCRFDLNPSVQEHDNEQQELHDQRQTTNNLAMNEQNESKMVKPLSESINDNNDIYSLISDDSLTDEDRDLIMNVSPKSSNETTELIMALDPSITFTIYGQEVEIINQHLFKRSAKLLKGKVSEKDLLHSMRQIERLHLGDHVRLKSHLYSYYGQTRKGDRFFDSIDNFHSFATVVICQNQYHIGTEPCGYQSSLEAYKLSNNGPPIDEGFSGFRCPNCNQLTCELCIDLTIILKDCDGNLLECHWTGLNSNRYFGCSTKELYNIHNDRQKPSFLVRINALLKYLWCASKLSSEKNDRDIIWTIAVCRSKQPETEVEYQIEDVNVLLKPKKKLINFKKVN